MKSVLEQTRLLHRDKWRLGSLQGVSRTADCQVDEGIVDHIIRHVSNPVSSPLYNALKTALEIHPWGFYRNLP